MRDLPAEDADVENRGSFFAGNDVGGGMASPTANVCVTADAPCRDQPYDDNYLYCDECQQVNYGNCPIHGPLNRIEDCPTSEDDPVKAISSLPPGLVISRMSTSGSSLGVFSWFDLPKNTVFGPYVGREVPFKSVEIPVGDYCWQINGPYEPSHWIDSRDLASSNWLRFVRLLTHSTEQHNLESFQYKRRIFFRAITNIKTGTELLVRHGADYARTLVSESVLTQEPTNEYVPDILPVEDDSDPPDDVPGDAALLDSSHLDETFKADAGLPYSAATLAKILSPPALSETSDPKFDGEGPVLRSSQVQSDLEFDYVACPKCPLSFSCPALLKNHLDEIHSKPLFTEECQFCDRLFKSPRSLIIHSSRMHKDGDAKVGQALTTGESVPNSHWSIRPRGRPKHTSIGHAESTAQKRMAILKTSDGDPELKRGQLTRSGRQCNELQNSWQRTILNKIPNLRRRQARLGHSRLMRKLLHRDHAQVNSKSPASEQTPNEAASREIPQTTSRSDTEEPQLPKLMQNEKVAGFRRCSVILKRLLIENDEFGAVDVNRYSGTRQSDKVGSSIGGGGDDDKEISETGAATKKPNPKDDSDTPTYKNINQENVGDDLVDLVLRRKLTCQIKRLNLSEGFLDNFTRQSITIAAEGSRKKAKATDDEIDLDSPVLDLIKPPGCPFCGLQKKLWELKRGHFATHGRRMTYKCEGCPQHFSAFADFKTHQSGSGHRGTIYRFLYLKSKSVVAMPKVKSSSKRIQKSEKMKIKCHLCNRVLLSFRNWRRHMVSVHSIRVTNQCKKCQQKFYSLLDFKIHQNTLLHEGKVMCFEPLETHILKSHTSETLLDQHYKCKLRCKSFLKLYCLNRHVLKVHEPMRRNRSAQISKGSSLVESCKRKAKNSPDVNLSKKPRDNGTQEPKPTSSEKPPPAGEAQATDDKIDLDSSVLDLIKPRECPFCGLRVKRPSDFKGKHLAVHGRHMTYKCEDCSQHFSAFADFKTHQSRSEHRGLIYRFLSLKSGPSVVTPNTECVESNLKSVTQVESSGKRIEVRGSKENARRAGVNKDVSRAEGCKKKVDGKLLPPDLQTTYPPEHQKCPVCAVTLRKPDHLKYHVFVLHQMIMTLMCNECRESYETLTELTAHQASSDHSGILNHFSKSRPAIDWPARSVKN